MPRTGRLIPGLKPASGRVGWPRDFQQYRKLCRIGVLRFIENHAEILFAHSLRRSRVLKQLICKRDLIGIRNNSSFQTKIAVVALNFHRDAESGICNPSSQRCERSAPQLREFRIRTGEIVRPTKELPIRRTPPLPFSQFHLRPTDVVTSPSVRRSIYFAEIDFGAGFKFSWPQKGRTRSAA